jgi:hypothetical protein
MSCSLSTACLARSSRGWLLAVGLLLLAARPASAVLVYSADFQGAVGTEWSLRTVSAVPADATRRFLGEFSGESVTLTLANLPANLTQLSIGLDLFIIRTWDGNNATWGSDVWALDAAGVNLFQATFSNWPDPAWNQTYPDPYPGGTLHPAGTGAAEVNTLGYGQDSVYHLSFAFAYTGSSIIFTLYTPHGLQGVSDESWGIDNVTVTASVAAGAVPIVPEPATLLTALAGLGAVAGAARRRSVAALTGSGSGPRQLRQVLEMLVPVV